MHDYIVTSPFVERMANGEMKSRLAGDHITDEAEVEALMANANPHHLMRIPTTREPAPASEIISLLFKSPISVDPEYSAED